MSSDFFYPQRMGRIILQSMEEVMGRAGVHSVLNLASYSEFIENYPPADSDRTFPFESVSGIQSALEQAFGPRGGRGLALRIGRACFNYGLGEFGSVLGQADLTYRLLPLPMKLKMGAEAFCDVFNGLSDQVVRLIELDDHYLWENVRCPLCWGRQTKTPCCHLAVGLVQEALYWVSGGKHFDVIESTCAGRGDELCTFVVAKQPLD
jgi:hypothetical protein